MERLRPVLARTEHTKRPTRPAAYDCVRIIVLRDGSLILSSQQPIRSGEVILIAPGATVGYQPEGLVTITTIFADTDYLIEHMFWQHLGLFADRFAAHDFAARIYPDQVQVLRLGERQVESLGPALDELAIRSATARDGAEYFRTHALLFTVLETLAPHILHAPVSPLPLKPQERALRVDSPRWQVLRPVRHEAMQAVALMRDNMAKRWRVETLAAHACLSVSQFTRVFRASFGVSPMTYLSILRVQEMARLIRETNKSIATISERVGWAPQDGQASRVFRRYMGTSPSNYRRHGPPGASREGPGVGVSRALYLSGVKSHVLTHVLPIA